MLFTDLGIITPDESTAAEKRLLEAPETDTVTIYTRDSPTVSLGRFSDVNELVNVAYAKEHDISIVRRISGGSAIYCDSNQLTYTVVTERSRFKDKSESYEIICGCIIRTLEYLGVKAEYKPLNDVLVNGMKISGCAQYRNRARLIHHGSLILRLDSDTMDRVLIPVKDRKYGRLTSVEEYLGHVPKREEICKAFREGFADL